VPVIVVESPASRLTSGAVYRADNRYTRRFQATIVSPEQSYSLGPA